MNPRKRFLSALLGGRVDRPSVVCVNQTATHEQMQELGVWWPNAHRDPILMAKLAAGAYHLLGLDAVRVPFCQTVEAEVLGAPIRDGDRDTLPSSSEHPFAPGQAVAIPTDLLTRGRIPVVLEALRILRRQLGEVAAVIGGVVGPFSVAGHLLGTDRLLMQSFLEPESLKPAMDAAVEVAAHLANAMVAAGADAICIEDMAASTDLIRPQTFDAVVLPRLKTLASQIQAPVVLHICGKVDAILDSMVATGADALSIDTKTDLTLALDAAAGNATVIGPVGTTDVLLAGGPNDAAAACRSLIDAGVSIVAPSCAIPPGTPTANVRAMVDAASSHKPARGGRAPGFASTGKGRPVFVRYDVRLHRPESRVSSGIADPLLSACADAVILGKRAEVADAVRAALTKHSPLDIINKALVPAIDKVGELWDQEYFFLPQVILAADAMQAGMQVCEEAMGSAVEKRGKVVMHVAEGDVHSIGKNIVKSLLTANGFEVIDLGVDVPVERVVQAVKEHRPMLLTGSALMTTTMTAFPRIAKRLQEEGLEVPFACGGGAVSQAFCESFPFGIYGGKGNRAPAIAKAAAEGKSWQELRAAFHR